MPTNDEIIMGSNPSCEVIGCNKETDILVNNRAVCLLHLPKLNPDVQVTHIRVIKKEQVTYLVPRGERCRVSGCPGRATHVCNTSGLKVCLDHVKAHGFEGQPHTFTKLNEWRRKKASRQKVNQIAENKFRQQHPEMI